jgi:hypothetical protein
LTTLDPRLKVNKAMASVMRFHQTIPNGFYASALRLKLYTLLEQLQTDDNV